MNAVEILCVIVTVCVISLCVLITLQFFRALNRALVHADSIHERATQHVDTTLDRLMAMDFATFKAYQLAEQGEVGGYTPPEPEERVEVETRPLRRDGRPWEREETSLPAFEDFDEEEVTVG